MDSHILEGLTLRLEATERALRAARRAMWMGSFLVVLAMCGAAWWVTNRMPTAVAPATVEAQQFIVRDAQGFARAVFESLPNGGTQLVVFRDPQPGEKWRERTGTGPFSFGLRSLSNTTQLMLNDRDGATFQLMSGNFSFSKNDTPMVTLATDPAGGRIWLADSTGHMQVLSAGLLADVAKRSAKPSPVPKHRRRR